MSSMAQERIELRLSPANPEEQALNEALLREGDGYGAKGRFLKARVLRGYVAFVREVESIRRETDPLAALDRIAQSVNSGHYRVLRALLYARTAISDARAGGGVDAPGLGEHTSEELLEPATDNQAEFPPDDTPPAAPPPRTHSNAVPAQASRTGPRVDAVPDWSMFAQIAGKKSR
ncbi:MAG: hypothetical protein JWL65_7216 [Gammaproteobacteria bacterium]|nr:hypothetical protein [Gammaproteobacteria bacterium]